MTRVEHIKISHVDIPPKVQRTDAIQSFVTQEAVFVTLRCADGNVGAGYTYTISTGGSSVVTLLRVHLAPRLTRRNPQQYEATWRDLFLHTHGTAVGAITRLALCSIDTTLWSRNSRVAGMPQWQLTVGIQARVLSYSTQGGWLQLETGELVCQAQQARANGFVGAKIKGGKEHVAEDMACLGAVRDAVGPDFEIMVDANQRFTLFEGSGALAGSRHWTWLSLRNPCPQNRLAATPACANLTAYQSRWVNPFTTPRSLRNTSRSVHDQLSSPMWRAWAASRLGSKSPIWLRAMASRSNRIFSSSCMRACALQCRMRAELKTLRSFTISLPTACASRMTISTRPTHRAWGKRGETDRTSAGHCFVTLIVSA